MIFRTTRTLFRADGLAIRGFIYLLDMSSDPVLIHSKHIGTVNVPRVLFREWVNYGLLVQLL